MQHDEQWGTSSPAQLGPQLRGGINRPLHATIMINKCNRAEDCLRGMADPHHSSHELCLSPPHPVLLLPLPLLLLHPGRPQPFPFALPLPEGFSEEPHAPESSAPELECFSFPHVSSSSHLAGPSAVCVCVDSRSLHLPKSALGDPRGHVLAAGLVHGMPVPFCFLSPLFPPGGMGDACLSRLGAFQARPLLHHSF